MPAGALSAGRGNFYFELRIPTGWRRPLQALKNAGSMRAKPDPGGIDGLNDLGIDRCASGLGRFELTVNSLQSAHVHDPCLRGAQARWMEAKAAAGASLARQWGGELP